jgi:TP53 regulating kinase and related kinases
MLRLHRSGVNVPGIRMVDVAEGVLGIEWIEGKSVRRLLPGGTEENQDGEGEEAVVDPLESYGVSQGLTTLIKFPSDRY